MNELQIAEIARIIVRGELLHNWEFYLIFVFLSVIAAAVVGAGGEYLRTRGKALATKADFNDLLEQLRKTTDLTENIKRVISLEDWRLKEYKTLQRTKLEELLIAVHDCHHWINRRVNWWWSDDDPVKDQNPEARVSIISMLYFPQLVEIKDFNITYSVFNQFVVDAKSKLNAVKGDQSKTKAAWNEILAEYKTHVNAINLAILKVEESASKLMKNIIEQIA